MLLLLRLLMMIQYALLYLLDTGCLLQGVLSLMLVSYIPGMRSMSALLCFKTNASLVCSGSSEATICRAAS